MSEQQKLSPGLDQLTKEDLSTLRRALTSLSNFPEWDQYLEFLKRQIEVRKNNVCFTPIQSLDEAIAAEYQKGEISGLYLTANLLPLTIEAITAEIEEKKKDEDSKEDA